MKRWLRRLQIAGLLVAQAPGFVAEILGLWRRFSDLEREDLPEHTVILSRQDVLLLKMLIRPWKEIAEELRAKGI